MPKQFSEARSLSVFFTPTYIIPVLTHTFKESTPGEITGKAKILLLRYNQIPFVVNKEKSVQAQEGLFFILNTTLAIISHSSKFQSSILIFKPISHGSISEFEQTEILLTQDKPSYSFKDGLTTFTLNLVSKDQFNSNLPQIEIYSAGGNTKIELGKPFFLNYHASQNIADKLTLTYLRLENEDGENAKDGMPFWSSTATIKLSLRNKKTELNFNFDSNMKVDAEVQLNFESYKIRLLNFGKIKNNKDPLELVVDYQNPIKSK